MDHAKLIFKEDYGSEFYEMREKELHHGGIISK